MRSALIIGRDSTIGSALAAYLSAHNIQTFSTSRRAECALQLDLSKEPSHWPALPHADIAYFCAAATKLETCEKEPEATRKINIAQLQMLAERLQKNGSFIVFLSSNQVFNGSLPYPKTSDAPCPVNEYGKQKYAFEQWLLARPSAAAVLRLTKVISAPLPILTQWEIALKKGETVEAFDDLIFAPLPLQAALGALYDIGRKKREGIFHLSGTRNISYYEIAQKLADKIGVDTNLIKPVSAASKAIPPQFLPKHGTLETSAFEGITIPEPEQIIF